MCLKTSLAFVTELKCTSSHSVRNRTVEEVWRLRDPDGPELCTDEGRGAGHVDDDHRHGLLDGVDLCARDEQVVRRALRQPCVSRQPKARSGRF